MVFHGVSGYRIVSAHDLAVLRSPDHELLDLQACEPRSSATHRYIVYRCPSGSSREAVESTRRPICVRPVRSRRCRNPFAPPGSSRTRGPRSPAPCVTVATAPRSRDPPPPRLRTTRLQESQPGSPITVDREAVRWPTSGRVPAAACVAAAGVRPKRSRRPEIRRCGTCPPSIRMPPTASSPPANSRTSVRFIPVNGRVRAVGVFRGERLRSVGGTNGALGVPRCVVVGSAGVAVEAGGGRRGSPAVVVGGGGGASAAAVVVSEMWSRRRSTWSSSDYAAPSGRPW